MTKRELMTELNKSGKVYAFVTWTEDDGTWIEVKKADIKEQLSQFNDDVKMRAFKEDGALYIG